jgi:hypothetical protein
MILLIACSPSAHQTRPDIMAYRLGPMEQTRGHHARENFRETARPVIPTGSGAAGGSIDGTRCRS